MAINNTYNTYTILAAGLTTSLPVDDSVDVYNFVASGGAVVLAGNISVSGSGTPEVQTTYNIRFYGGFTLGGNTCTFFGTTLTAEQCLYQQYITAIYNGSSYDVHISSTDAYPTPDIDGADLVNNSVTNAKLFGNIAITKIAPLVARGYMIRGTINGTLQGFDAKTSGNILMGDNTDVVSLPMSGDATINGAGVVTIASNAVTTSKILNSNVTVGKLESSLQNELVTIAASFETGEVGAIKFKMPYAGSITNIYAIATKAIAATDAGTVLLKNNSGTTMTVTTPIVFAISDPFGTAYSSSVTANNTFVANDILSITTAKATAGGKILVSLNILRS
jgi:hypothetical protein